MLPWFEQWFRSGQPFKNCELAVWSLGLMMSSGFRLMADDPFQDLPVVGFLAVL